jgi:hypothetical protein
VAGRRYHQLIDLMVSQLMMKNGEEHKKEM